MISNAIKISYLRRSLSATSAVNPTSSCTGRQIRVSRFRFAGSRDCQMSTLASGMAKLTLTRTGNFVPKQLELVKELTGLLPRPCRLSLNTLRLMDTLAWNVNVQSRGQIL